MGLQLWWQLIVLTVGCLDPATPVVPDKRSVFNVTEGRTNPGLLFKEAFQFKLVQDHWTLISEVSTEHLYDQADKAKVLFQSLAGIRNKYESSSVSDTDLSNVGTEILKLHVGLKALRALLSGDGKAEPREKRNAVVEGGRWLQRLKSLITTPVIQISEKKRETDLGEYSMETNYTGKKEVVTKGVKRVRKGIFNSLGTAVKLISGNLDAADGEYFEQKLREISEGTHDIHSLAAQQTTLMSATVHTLNGTLVSWEENRVSLEETIGNITAVERGLNHDVANVIDQLHVIRTETEARNILTELITSAKDNMQLILKTFEDARQGRINPLVLSPERLIPELRKIKLPAGLAFPIEPTYTGFHYFYDIVEVSAFTVGGNLTLIIKVPLVDSETYTMNEVTPFPYSSPYNNGTYIFIKPDSDFIGLSNQDLHYVLFSRQQQNLCKRVGKERVCPAGSIIHDFHSHTESCTVGIFKNRMSIGSECDLRVIELKRPLWIKTPTTNLWLFVIPDSESGIITCRDGTLTTGNAIKVPLSGRGFLSLKGGCMYISDSAQLRGVGNYKSFIDSQAPIIPMNSISLPTLVEETMAKVKPAEINITPHLLPMNMHLHELVETGRKISEIKNLLDAAEIDRLQTSQDNRHVAYISLFSVVLFAIITYFCRKPIIEGTKEVIGKCMIKRVPKPEVNYQQVPLGKVRVRSPESQTSTEMNSTSGGENDEGNAEGEMETETTEFRNSPYPRRMRKNKDRDLV